MSKKEIVRRPDTDLPATSRPSALGSLPDLPSSSGAWFGTRTSIMRKDADFIREHQRYLDARVKQIKSAHELVDERISIAAKIADMDNILIEIQRSREHERWQNEQKRNSERIQAAYDNQISVARKEGQLAQAREALTRAQRNCEAAERVAPAQVDQWYAEAEARKNNALAERQDTAADLARGRSSRDGGAPADAAAAQRALDLETVEHQIELERERGNQSAVLALMNLRARLRAA